MHFCEYLSNQFTDVPYVPGRDVVLEKLGISVDYWTQRRSLKN